MSALIYVTAGPASHARPYDASYLTGSSLPLPSSYTISQNVNGGHYIAGSWQAMSVSTNSCSSSHSQDTRDSSNNPHLHGAHPLRRPTLFGNLGAHQAEAIPHCCWPGCGSWVCGATAAICCSKRVSNADAQIPGSWWRAAPVFGHKGFFQRNRVRTCMKFRPSGHQQTSPAQRHWPLVGSWALLWATAAW